MTKEQRAEISRQNGAKSKGPITDQGKSNSSRNALKHGEYAQSFASFIPPRPAVLCNEDLATFQALACQMAEIYQPVNQTAQAIVRDIASARWQIDRLEACLTMHWNLSLVDNGQKPGALAPELFEMETMARSSRELYTGHAIIHRLNRQIDQLQLRIARLERRLKFVHANYPMCATVKNAAEQTCQPTENIENESGNEPPLYVTETNPAVIQAYKEQFPNRKIILLPPDDVARGIDIPDDMPVAPRRAA
jgi:hypothetical protein